jgi:ABC-2 type transport system permease protein
VTRRSFVLAGHSLVRLRGALIVLGVLLAGFQFLLTEVAAYLLREGAFSQLADLIPDFVRTAAGPEALGFMSFRGIVSLGYFHPIVLTSLVGLMITIATEPAGEAEMRFVDLILARPLTRVELITRTVLVLIAAGSLMLTLMVAGTFTGLACCAPAAAEPPSPEVILSLAVSLASIIAAWAGITLAIAASVRRRAVAGAIAGVTAFATYLLDYLGRAWEPAAPLGILSPFHYFEPMPITMGQALSAWNIGVLAVIALAGVVTGYVVFGRRDI